MCVFATASGPLPCVLTGASATKTHIFHAPNNPQEWEASKKRQDVHIDRIEKGVGSLADMAHGMRVGAMACVGRLTSLGLGPWTVPCAGCCSGCSAP